MQRSKGALDIIIPYRGADMPCNRLCSYFPVSTRSALFSARSSKLQTPIFRGFRYVRYFRVVVTMVRTFGFLRTVRIRRVMVNSAQWFWLCADFSEVVSSGRKSGSDRACGFRRI